MIFRKSGPTASAAIWDHAALPCTTGECAKVGRTVLDLHTPEWQKLSWPESLVIIPRWFTCQRTVYPSLDISTAPTPGRIITGLSRPAQRAHLTTGDGGLVVQGNPGAEPWRSTCDLRILDWRLRSDALRTDRLGGNSWQRLRLLTSQTCSWRREDSKPSK